MRRPASAAGSGRAGRAARARRRRAHRRRRLTRSLVVVTVVGLVAAGFATGAFERLEQRYRPFGPKTTPYAELFRTAAEHYPDVAASQLAAQARAESNFDPHAKSQAGAQGMMQIVPDTFRRFGVDGNGDGRRDVYAPADAVFTAAAYLTWLGKQLDAKTSDERVLAAYNAGPNAVRKAGGVPDYPETRQYVSRVEHWRGAYRWLDE